MHFMVDLLITH